MVLAALPFLITGLAACSAPDDPSAVAQAFWKAVLAGRTEEAATISTGAAEEIEALMPERRPTEVRHGEALRNEEHAEVPSTWVREDETGTSEVAFATVLVRTPHGWRVDVDATDRSLRQALLAASAEDIEKAMRLGAEAMGQALEQGAREAAAAMERAAEAMREALEAEEDPRPDRSSPDGATATEPL
jgi:urease accessory protein UreF